MNRPIERKKLSDFKRDVDLLVAAETNGPPSLPTSIFSHAMILYYIFIPAEVDFETLEKEFQVPPLHAPYSPFPMARKDLFLNNLILLLLEINHPSFI